MSRSRRRTPITAITTAETEKPYKTAEHRRERAAVRAAIAHGEDAPAPKAFGNPWGGDRDGKRWAPGLANITRR